MVNALAYHAVPREPMGGERLSIDVPSISFRANEMGPIYADPPIVNKSTGTAEGPARHPGLNRTIIPPLLTRRPR